MVPFNWLMPLVENAFIHGMKEVKEKRIWIHASEEGWLHVLLGKNGKQMEETQLRGTSNPHERKYFPWDVYGLSEAAKLLRRPVCNGYPIKRKRDGSDHDVSFC